MPRAAGARFAPATRSSSKGRASRGVWATRAIAAPSRVLEDLALAVSDLLHTTEDALSVRADAVLHVPQFGEDALPLVPGLCVMEGTLKPVDLSVVRLEVDSEIDPRGPSAYVGVMHGLLLLRENICKTDPRQRSGRDRLHNDERRPQDEDAARRQMSAEQDPTGRTVAARADRSGDRKPR